MDMYLKHFGLKAQPFQLTPDIGVLFMNEAHTRAKAYMDYTVWNREGRGTPRLINTLCDAALTCAYADNLPRVTTKLVEAAASELQWPSYSERVDKRRQKMAP